MRITRIQVHPRGKGDSSSKPRIYIFPKGETLIENLGNRKHRPYTAYKKEVLPVLLERLEQENPNEFACITGRKIHWSQYAGCSCPCSPGFIIDTPNGLFDISVDIEE
jgi:hypothetical protein